MKRFFFVLIAISMLLTIAGCSNKQASNNPVKLTVSAAISLTDALEEIKELYEDMNDVVLTYNFLGSGSLAQQIQQGAPVDVFISANEEWMEVLNDNNLLISETQITITGNRLVLIGQKKNELASIQVSNLSSNPTTQLVMGNPESVPAGAYTKQALVNLKQWDKLEKQIILSKDVRQALTYVETENVDYGVVYESDAHSSDRVHILDTIDDKLHDAIVYPGAVIQTTKEQEEAKKFLLFLQDDESQAIFKKYGFHK